MAEQRIAEGLSRKGGGNRPSSGAATPEPLSASYLWVAVRISCDAAPDDGRSPGLSEKVFIFPAPPPRPARLGETRARPNHSDRWKRADRAKASASFPGR